MRRSHIAYFFVVIWIALILKGGYCYLDGTCSGAGGTCIGEPNADTCSNQTPPECICNINYHPDVTATNCERKECFSDNPSIECGENTVCAVNNKCSCVANYVESGLACVQRSCQTNQNCTSFDPNSYCEDNLCVCKKNFGGSNSTECLRNMCFMTEDCTENNSYCIHMNSTKQCQCGNLAETNISTGACMPKTCTFMTASSICGANSYCLTGSSICACPINFEQGKASCVPKSCTEDDISKCDPNSECQNGMCACGVGFIASENECVDIDECVIGWHTCHDDSICTNTIGSFTCECISGYVGDGITCEAINCGHIDIIYVVDTSHSNGKYNITKIKNAALPMALQTPRILASRFRTNTRYYAMDYFQQITQSIQMTIKSPTAVGIGEYSSFISQSTTGETQNGNIIGIYEVEGVKALLKAADYLIVGIKKRMLEGNTISRGKSLCHPDATCTINKDIMKCDCKSGFIGDGFDCTENVWESWGKWSSCSSSCSPGIQVREKIPLKNVTAPTKSLNETKSCNLDLCNKYSPDKLSCLGQGRIPAPCKLRAIIENKSNTNFLLGSTEEIYEYQDKKMKVIKFKSKGMNLKFVNIEKKREN
uniref:protein eyes shut homolog n=1 Tax=Styela clava TaxID=7725 RepID=UPI0019392701|nr:protein eyes shut homolog [Styela clava]